MSHALQRLAHQGPALVWLTVVWVLLWGSVTWANVLGGLAVAVVVLVLLPLPGLGPQVRLHPVALARYLGAFVVDLTVSSAQVVRAVLSPRPLGRAAAIITVQLRTDSDLIATILSLTLTLVPGSIVLDVDRERRRIAVHLLLVRTVEDVERQRAGILDKERRAVAAFGTAADRAALERAVP